VVLGLVVGVVVALPVGCWAVRRGALARDFRGWWLGLPDRRWVGCTVGACPPVGGVTGVVPGSVGGLLVGG
jgi:hypothetical protein